MPTESKEEDGEHYNHRHYDPDDCSATTIGNNGRVSVTHRSTPSWAHLTATLIASKCEASAKVPAVQMVAGKREPLSRKPPRFERRDGFRNEPIICPGKT